MAQANVKLTVDASQATRALQGVQNRTTQLNGGLNRLKTAIAGVGLTVLARQAVNTSANFAKLNVRLGLLTKASGTFARSQELAAQAQKTFGLSATEALEGITDITARLQPLGVSVEDIKTTFFGFNTAAKLAGASAIESSNAFRQLAQALGSGRLQGDEFRSISEQIPTILKPVADELGTTVGELKKFSSEGKITSSVVIRALKKIESEGGKSLEALLKNDPTQVFKNLSNEAENLSRAFGDALAPAVLPVIRGITEITKVITDFINSGAGKVSLVFTGIAVAIKGITVVTPLIIGQLASLSASFQVAAINSALASTGLQGVAASSFLAAGGITKATIALSALKLALIKTGIGAAIVILGTLAAKFIDNKNATEASAKAAKDFDNNLKGIVDTGNKTEAALNDLAIANKEFALSQLGTSRNDKASALRLEREIDLLKDRKIILDGEAKRNKELAQNKKFNDATIAALKQITTLENKLLGKKDEQITLEDQINEIKKEYTGEDAKQLINLTTTIDALKKKNKELDKSKKAAEELKQKFADIGEEIETGLKDNLRDAITGAQSFGQAMTNVLNKIRDKIIDAQLDKILGQFGERFGSAATGGDRKGLGGFVGNLIGGLFKANGGPVKAGQPYIVGERQPELFVPRTSGTILPSVPSGGGGTTNMITVNVDASGTSVQGNGSEADQLGGLIASVVQATIIDEQRAGGLLNR